MTFLLAGTTMYTNRGCEAIMRGTVAVLRRHFGPDLRFVAASFGTVADLRSQMARERDPLIEHVRLDFGRLSIPYVLDQCNRRLGFRTPGRHWMLRKAVKEAAAALLVGGDNYSLDYGVPEQYFRLDEYLLARGVPAYLWGASVGPFTADPKFARRAHAHLNELQGIFVRETLSYEYLRSNGISAQVKLVADPAFALEPEEPSPKLVPEVLSELPIGLNFSPLMARYVTGGDLAAWRRICAETVICLMRKAGEGLLLIPHVFQPWGDNDDGIFLSEVAECVYRETRTRVEVASRELSAAQLKWVISHCRVFVGARTHATIAALSTAVPTLSLAYSVKARGLNQDMLGSLEYCLSDPCEMTPEVLVGRTLTLTEDRDRLRDILAARMPAVKARAYAAGGYLAEYLAHPASPCVGNAVKN